MNQYSQVFQCIICAILFFVSSIVSAADMAVPVQVVDARNIELAPGIWIAGTVISHQDARISSEVEEIGRAHV